MAQKVSYLRIISELYWNPSILTVRTFHQFWSNMKEELNSCAGTNLKVGAGVS